MADYIPHTEDEVSSMLDFLGLETLGDLFAHVPAAVRLSQGLNLADGRSEPDVAVQFESYTSANVATTKNVVCFAGVGSYDHEVPAVVKMLGSRSEFVTAYTPYQPEVAQGVLQAIFEYQTMIARLSGLPIANASLYDAATALVEAVNMAVGSTRKNRILMSAGIHPHWRATVATFARGTGHEIVTVPLVNGQTDWSTAPLDNVGAVVVGYPNYLGILEDIASARAVANDRDALLIVGADPVAAGVLKTSGDWGADIFVGEGQPFGTPLAFGGPYLGLFACTSDQIRRLPGRIVGETVDTEGRRAFVTTLRAREQDIRREKATSNVCTNQTLMAVTAAIQMSWLGTEGLREVATRCAQGAHYLYEALLEVPGVSAVSDAPFFREFAFRTTRPARELLADVASRGFMAGVAASDLCAPGDASLPSADLDYVIVSTVTEKRTKVEIDALVAAIAKAVQS